MGSPHGHRKTTKLVAGLRMSGMIAPMVLDGPINGDWFEAYHSGPRARAQARRHRHHGQSLESQSLESQKGIGARDDRTSRRDAAAPPAYSPDCNPIEKAFARLKAMLGKAAERAVSGLWDLIGRLADLCQPDECAHYFSSCGYDSLPDHFIDLAYDECYQIAAAFLPILIGTRFSIFASLPGGIVIGIGKTSNVALSNAVKLISIVRVVPQFSCDTE